MFDIAPLSVVVVLDFPKSVVVQGEREISYLFFFWLGGEGVGEEEREEERRKKLTKLPKILCLEEDIVLVLHSLYEIKL